MSFAPDPDTGDLEGSIGAWVGDPDRSTVTRDTTLSRSGDASLRVTNIATPTFDYDPVTIALIPIDPTPLAVVATAPAPDGVGSITVSGWYYLQDATFDVVELDLDVFNSSLGAMGSASTSHDPFGATAVTHDAWTQISVTVDSLEPSQAAFFAVAAVGGRVGGVPAGAYMRWDDFDFVGALSVAAPSGWVVG